VGNPAIRIVKEVSVDGVNWEDVSVTATPPADAFYRIAVTNIGTVDLENVTVSDPDLGLVDVDVTGAAGLGMLAVGETVVLVHEDLLDGSNPNIVADLEVPGLCAEGDGFTFVNVATANGTPAGGGSPVSDSDNASYTCQAKFDICTPDGPGRPSRLKMQYDADDDSDNGQGDAFVNIIETDVDLPDVVTIKTYSKSTSNLLDTFVDVAKYGSFFVYDPSTSGKIPPNILIQIFDGATLLRTIKFHGSCSAPLAVGDEYGATTIIGVEYF
jgi:hypothetical protein